MIIGFVLIILGGSYLLMKIIPEDLIGDGLNTSRKYDSVKEMEEELGFSMPDVKAFPFTASESEYHSYNGRIGEIAHAGENQVILLRKAKGNTVTGDNMQYKSTEKRTVEGVEVTISSASGEGFMAADFVKSEAYIYSIRLGKDYSEDVILDAVRSVMQDPAFE